MINHQATVLHHLDTASRECFGNLVMTDAGLHPHGLRLFYEHVVQMRGNVLGSPKYVYQINFGGYVGQRAIDLLPEDRYYARIVDRHRNDFKTSEVQVPGNVESGLARLGKHMKMEILVWLCIVP